MGSEPTDTPWRGLHPASLLVNLLPTTWRTARASWPILFALVLGNRRRVDDAFNLVLLLMFFTSSIARTVTHFATLRYRLHEGKLELRSGLLSRTVRVVDPARIQNVNIVQNLFHRLAGLVELRVETAGESPMEGTLSALSKDEAEALKAALEAEAHPDGPGAVQADEEPPTPLAAVSAVEAVAYGLTQRTVGVIAVLTAIGFEAMARMSPSESQDIARNADPLTLGALVALALVGSWVFSAGSALLRFYGQTLQERGERLIIENGLFTRRRVEIPLGKVQFARIDEPLLRRLLGYGSLTIETAAFGALEGGVRQAEGRLIMVAQDRRAYLLGAALPALDLDPYVDPLLPAHPKALARRRFWAAARGLAVLGFALHQFGTLGAWAAVYLFIALLRATREHHAQGYAVTPHVVVVRGGYWSRFVGVLDRAKIQSVQVVQNPAQRWLGLGSVVVRVAGTGMALPPVSLEQAQEIRAALVPG